MINLYGSLARKFQKIYGVSPKEIDIKVSSGGEMIRAMNANFPGFRNLIRRSGAYKIVRGDAITNGMSISKEEINMRFKTSDWHIMPVARASGFGKFLPTILGVALIALSFFVPPAAVLAGSLTWSTALFSVGAAMVLGGISMLLMPGAIEMKEADNTPSYIFNGPKNSVTPGLAIPVIHGEVYAGSITISGGVESRQLISKVITAEIEEEEEYVDWGYEGGGP